jgi:hypothetical protein
MLKKEMSAFMDLRALSGVYEEFYLVGYNPVQSVEIQQLASCYFKPEDVYVPPKRQLAFSGLQKFVPHKTELFLFNTMFSPQLHFL